MMGAIRSFRKPAKTDQVKRYHCKNIPATTFLQITYANSLRFKSTVHRT